MPIPVPFELTLPVLMKVGDGEDWSTQRLAAELGQQFALTAEERTATRADGRLLFVNRIEWARTWLKKAELISYPRPRTSRITPAGRCLLAAHPAQLDRDFFILNGCLQSANHETALGTGEERLEDELRRLSGPAVASDDAWDVVRRVNGWGPESPTTYRQVAKELGTEVGGLLDIARACRTSIPDEAPMLDAALRVAAAREDVDPYELSLDLAFAGITKDAFSLPGLAEAARRFGRFAEWHQLLRYLSDNRGPRRRPRPFESWFELDVFLWLVDAGYDVRAQRRIGPYRVDMVLPDLVPQLVVECDGDAYHRGERLDEDRVRERWLQHHGYRIVRLRFTDYRDRPHAIKEGLLHTLGMLTVTGLQLRMASQK